MAEARHVAPAVNQTAFNCPHCGALAKQFWHSTYAENLRSDEVPTILYPDQVATLKLQEEDAQERARLEGLLARAAAGRPFLERNQQFCNHIVNNLAVARCFNCNEISLWIHDGLLWPQVGDAPRPNSDLSEEVRRDFEEAGIVLAVSPRGAAALLRLCVQKLCLQLGEKGKNIDEDIAALVRRGLDVRVQKALDVVRVIGNNAVHPGQIDLRDDRPTAEKLFGLINLIADIMISQPKHVTELYDGLPEGARKAIERRDGPKDRE